MTQFLSYYQAGIDYVWRYEVKDNQGGRSLKASVELKGQSKPIVTKVKQQSAGFNLSHMLTNTYARRTLLTFDVNYEDFRVEGYNDDSYPVCTIMDIAESLPSAVQGNTTALDTQMRYLYSVNQTRSVIPSVRAALADTFFPEG